MTDYYAISLQGARPAMEDTHVLWREPDRQPEVLAGAIFDGHLGGWVAEAGRQHYLNAQQDPARPAEILRQIHAGAGHAFHMVRAPDAAGGACAVAFHLEGDRLLVANVGDAEAVLVWPDGAFEVLTEMHRVTNQAERERVRAAGAFIQGPYVYDPATGRGLMPTRSLGDHAFEHVGIICEPFEREATFETGWLVLACDGLWDVIQHGQVPGLLSGCTSAKEAAMTLALEAFGRGTTDNLSVMVVRRP